MLKGASEDTVMHTSSRCSLALAAFLVGLILLSPSLLAADPPALDVRFVTDEADAVLSILGKRAKKEAVTEADWQLWRDAGPLVHRGLEDGLPGRRDVGARPADRGRL
jgi:hypothetical protein